MIRLENVHKQFGRFVAVDNLSLQIAPGEVLGFLGPNGAGKSTTMRMLTGFLPPDRGTISIFGYDIERAPLAARRLMGYLPEGAPSYDNMVLSRYLDFIARARGLSRQQAVSAVDRIMQLLQLQSKAQAPIKHLSKGYQRRVGIAQALLHDPKVLILDEPTDGLDPNQKHQMRHLIQELSREKIVIISTHILEEVEALCNRAVILHHGRIVADATPQALKHSSRFFQAVELEMPHVVQHLSDLMDLPDVECVERAPETPDKVVLFPRQQRWILPTVQAWLASMSLTPTALSVSSGRLDDVFRRLTCDPVTQQEGDAQ